MKMDITINGKTVPVEFEALLNHTETPNSSDPIASRDIISLVDTSVMVNVLGQDYIFTLEGFIHIPHLSISELNKINNDIECRTIDFFYKKYDNII